MSGGQGKPKTPNPEKKFSEPLDKQQILCYNKDVPSKGWTLRGEKLTGRREISCNPKERKRTGFRNFPCYEKSCDQHLTLDHKRGIMNTKGEGKHHKPERELP